MTLALVALGEAAVRPQLVAEIAGILVLAAIVPLLFVVAVRYQPRPPAEEPEEELVVAGITQGTAPVPRWLYAVYVLVPLWALVYLATSSRLRSEFTPSLARPAGRSATSAAATPRETPGPRTEWTIVARNIAFNLKELILPAHTPVRIVFDNRDPGVPHNVAIYTDSSASSSIFGGEIVNGTAKRTYAFDAPAPGTYFFRCDVHPSMSGTVRVI